MHYATTGERIQRGNEKEGENLGEGLLYEAPEIQTPG
jgi:hypothetical protein